MTKIRTIAPSELAVDLAAARANLRVDGSDMDALITTWLKGIIGKLEHEAGQCLMAQTWEVRLAGFPAGAINLPHPVMGVTSVTYLDAAGVAQTLAPAAYTLTVERYTSRLTPARGTTWPATADDPAAVIVTVQCGYGNTSDKTPENVQLYILAKLVEQFDPATRMERDTVQSAFLDSLLDGIRCYQ